MPGNYSVTTRASGSILTATIYNTDHGLHVTYNTPGGCDDASATVVAMQATADPGEVGSESLPTDLLGELHRLRHIISEITGKSEWYETPGTNLAAAFAKGADIASATTLIPVGDFAFADVTGSVQTEGINTEAVGKKRTFRFTGTPLLKHSAAFVLPGAADYQVTAGQFISFYSLGSGNWLMGEARIGGSYRFTSSGGKTGTFIHANTADRNYTMQDSSHVVVGRDTTDTLTNKTFDAQGTGNSLTNVSTSALKTATGSAAGSTEADITMHDYAFAPMIRQQLTGGTGTARLSGQSIADPSNTVGRLRVYWDDLLYATVEYTVRWRYVTASDNPEIWVVYDPGDGHILGVWAADDPAGGGEPGLRVAGYHSVRLTARDLEAWSILSQKASEAESLIHDRRLRMEHHAYRALQLVAGDAAPAQYIRQHAHIDVVTQRLREGAVARTIPLERLS